MIMAHSLIHACALCLRFRLYGVDPVCDSIIRGNRVRSVCGQVASVRHINFVVKLNSLILVPKAIFNGTKSSRNTHGYQTLQNSGISHIMLEIQNIYKQIHTNTHTYIDSDTHTHTHTLTHCFRMKSILIELIEFY